MVQKNSKETNEKHKKILDNMLKVEANKVFYKIKEVLCRL
jgi:hypothetical protein